MSTVLACTSPAIGHLLPMVPLLLELKARGHDVHVRTLPAYVEHLRREGLEARPVDARLLELVHRDYTGTSSRPTSP